MTRFVLLLCGILWTFPGHAQDTSSPCTIKRVGNRMGVTAIRAYHASDPDQSVAEASASRRPRALRSLRS